MATTTVAAAGTALALYYYTRSQAPCFPSEEGETHITAYRAPKSFLEDLYFFAEALRYTYGETFGRWRSIDLLVGLAYLCRKDSEEHPVADIARHGTVFALNAQGAERIACLQELRRLDRFFRYCSGLRERRPVFQRRYFVEMLGIPEDNILMQELRAGVLKPSYILTCDSNLKAIVLAVRGTHSFKDAFTSLTGASKPHHVVDSNGVVLGYSHFGMLAAARWLKTQVTGPIEAALAANPGYQLHVVGHSLGGGTAAMLTMMLRETGGLFSETTCTAIACPACMTLELAKSCSAYVTTVIHGADVIPTISAGSADALRQQVASSSWGSDFRRDLRASALGRVVETGLRGVGTATATASSWTATRISSCYQRRPALRGGVPVLKRRNSDTDLANPTRTRRVVSPSGAVSLGVATDAAPRATDAKRSQGQASPSCPADGPRNSLLAFLRVFSDFSSTSLRTLFEKKQRDGLPPAARKSDSARQEQTRLEFDLPNSDAERPVEGTSALLEAPGAMETDTSRFKPDGLTTDGALDLRGPEADSLEAEAELRMREVERAVEAAESEECAVCGDGRDATEVQVPAVIRPGSYGGDGSAGYTTDRSSHSRARDNAWRRMMYPAGRIMHLVPARLVPGLEGWSGVAEADRATLERDWPEAWMEEEDESGSYRQYESASCWAKLGEEEGGMVDGHLDGGGAHAREPSKKSSKDTAASEDGTELAVSGVSEGNGPLLSMKDTPGPPPEPMVLLDGVPQEAYGRIKLCRTVLTDHVIPNYLRSLESFLQRL